jgi:hypothetical protein
MPARPSKANDENKSDGEDDQEETAKEDKSDSEYQPKDSLEEDTSVDAAEDESDDQEMDRAAVSLEDSAPPAASQPQGISNMLCSETPLQNNDDDDDDDNDDDENSRDRGEAEAETTGSLRKQLFEQEGAGGTEEEDQDDSASEPLTQDSEETTLGLALDNSTNKRKRKALAPLGDKLDDKVEKKPGSKNKLQASGPAQQQEIDNNNDDDVSEGEEDEDSQETTLDFDDSQLKETDTRELQSKNRKRQREVTAGQDGSRPSNSYSRLSHPSVASRPGGNTSRGGGERTNTTQRRPPFMDRFLRNLDRIFSVRGTATDTEQPSDQALQPFPGDPTPVPFGNRIRAWLPRPS